MKAGSASVVINPLASAQAGIKAGLVKHWSLRLSTAWAQFGKRGLISSLYVHAYSQLSLSAQYSHKTMGVGYRVGERLNKTKKFLLPIVPSDFER